MSPVRAHACSSIARIALEQDHREDLALLRRLQALEASSEVGLHGRRDSRRRRLHARRTLALVLRSLLNTGLGH